MGIVWENTTPSTELPRDFCARIGPLQLGVVLVSFRFRPRPIYKKYIAQNAHISDENETFMKSKKELGEGDIFSIRHDYFFYTFQIKCTKMDYLRGRSILSLRVVCTDCVHCACR